MSSCDSISSELAALRADIQSLSAGEGGNNNFQNKVQPQNLSNQLNYLARRVAILEAYKESLERDANLINSLVEKIIKMILSFFGEIDDKF